MQRTRSNRAAARGGDPCVPAAGDGPYGALVPDQSVVRLRHVGATTTITLTAVTSVDEAVAWRIAAVDLAADEGGAFVDATLDRTEVHAGDRVTLTVTARRTHPRERTAIGVISRVGAREHLWPIAVSLR